MHMKNGVPSDRYMMPILFAVELAALFGFVVFLAYQFIKYI